MISSKDGRRQEEEMFDSWIERQSFITNNKENIGVQLKKIKKVVVQPPVKGCDPSRAKTPMAEMIQQTEYRDTEEGGQMRESN
jgi:hypothetical protein